MTSKQITFLFSFLYFILAILVISVKLINLPDLENIFKPFLMILLMIWYGIDQRMNNIKINMIFILAIFFSLLGDVFLMPFFDHFIFGLVFFLISHLFYVSVFIKGNMTIILPSLKQGKIFVIGVFSVYLGLLFVLILAILKLENIVLLIAVPLYATVLLLMVLSAFVYSKVHFYNFGRFVMIGGLLFLVSDGILALNKFSFEIALAPLLVMGTYTLAQWMLVYGYMNSKKVR